MEITVSQIKENHLLTDKVKTTSSKKALKKQKSPIFIDSKENLGLIFDTIEDSITVSGPRGRLIYVNDKGRNITKKYQILNEKKAPISKEEFTDRIALKTKTTAEKILCFRKLDYSEEKWFLAKSTPILDQKGQVKFVINVFKNITHQKQTQDSMRFLAEAGKIFVSSLDYSQTLSSVAKLAVPKIADWCAIHIVNERKTVDVLALAHIDPKKVIWAKKYQTEYPVDMSTNQGIAKVIKTGKAEFYPEVTEQMIKQAAKTKKELTLLKKIGLNSVMVLPLTVDKKTFGALSFVTSESKRRYSVADLYMAEQLANRAALAIENSKLFQNAQELASLVESSDDAIIGKSLDTIILGWNFGAERLYGYKAHEVIGQPLSVIFPKENLDELSEIMEIIKMGQSIDHFETARKSKDGKLIDVSLSISPIKDKSGRIIGASTIARDISQTKELERRKDAFINMASHELKTPITTIRAFVQLLQKKLEDNPDPEINKFLEKTCDQTYKITDLISHLLDLSKIQTGHLELNKNFFDFDTHLENIIEEMQATNPSHKIRLEGSTAIKLLGDKDRIGQVLINMINNAVKYSPNGKKVLVKAENNGKNIIVSVKDSGIGISKSHQKRIFDRFYRAAGRSERTFPGLGIGLYISAEIIKRHGGKIWVRSNKGRGSVFFISLPIK